MLVNYYTITYVGLGKYKAELFLEDPQEEDDILQCTNECYELGASELDEDENEINSCPEWVEDIRGNIENEPDRVYVDRTDGRVIYFGLSDIVDP